MVGLHLRRRDVDMVVRDTVPPGWGPRSSSCRRPRWPWGSSGRFSSGRPTPTIPIGCCRGACSSRCMRSCFTRGISGSCGACGLRDGHRQSPDLLQGTVVNPLQPFVLFNGRQPRHGMLRATNPARGSSFVITHSLNQTQLRPLSMRHASLPLSRPTKKLGAGTGRALLRRAALAPEPRSA